MPDCLNCFRYNINPKDIGHLEVGTETLLDKSKSVKSVLMQLLESNDCTDIEGVDCKNACYGGTAALFNAINWVESSAWDGRLAVVVAADNAVYEKGPARPTGGAGAIAMVIGPDAPLVFDRGVRSSHMSHAYDFYKPNQQSEYPVVDGKLSIECYLKSLDTCYQRYRTKVMKQSSKDVSLAHFDGFLFHSPYGKLVQKSFARLAFMDFLNKPKEYVEKSVPELVKFHGVDPKDTYFDRDIEKEFMNRSKEDFENKTKPSLYIANLVGNMYTPSVYSGLVSLLIEKSPQELLGNKVGVFSYGSGLTSSMYSISVTSDIEQLNSLRNKMTYVTDELHSRTKFSPEEYSQTLDERQKSTNVIPFEPKSSISHLFPGTYYLTKVDEKYRRTYQRV